MIPFLYVYIESHNPLTFVNMADTPDSVDSTK